MTQFLLGKFDMTDFTDIPKAYRRDADNKALFMQSKAPVTTDDLVDDLTTIAERIRRRIRQTTLDIIAIGQDLRLVKAQLDHGDFITWIEKEFGMTIRTAQRWMQAAKFAEGKNDIVSHLPQQTILLLAAPSTPNFIKKKVIADLEAGHPVDHRAIKDEVTQTKYKAKVAERIATREKLVSQTPSARRSREQRRKRFDGAYGMLIQSCINATTMEMPMLSQEKLKEIVRELKEAERNVRTLRVRILDEIEKADS